MKRGATTTCREAFVKCASRGTVILKGESAENKSTQQSWPTFMLECFQRQQSLFSYAINCLNRLPVEFLMCYKFRVCFPWVDSTQAYCVRPCPVISAGLGRTSTTEKKPVHALSLCPPPPFLNLTFFSRWLIVHKLGLSSRVTMESIRYICALHQWPSAMYSERFFLCAHLSYSGR